MTFRPFFLFVFLALLWRMISIAWNSIKFTSHFNCFSLLMTYTFARNLTKITVYIWNVTFHASKNQLNVSATKIIHISGSNRTKHARSRKKRIDYKNVIVTVAINSTCKWWFECKHNKKLLFISKELISMFGFDAIRVCDYLLFFFLFFFETSAN